MDCGRGGSVLHSRDGDEVACVLTDPASGIEYDTVVSCTCVDDTEYDTVVQAADTAD